MVVELFIGPLEEWEVARAGLDGVVDVFVWELALVPLEAIEAKVAEDGSPTAAAALAAAAPGAGLVPAAVLDAPPPARWATALAAELVEDG